MGLFRHVAFFVAASLFAPIFVPSAASANPRQLCAESQLSEGERATYPNVTADRARCESGYFGIRVESGPYAFLSIAPHFEYTLENVVNVYTEVGIGLGSQTREREIGWAPVPFANVYAGFPISWVSPRENRRWIVKSEMIDYDTISHSYYTVTIPRHSRFVPELGLMYGRPVDLRSSESPNQLSFGDRTQVGLSAGFRWVRSWHANLHVLDNATGSDWTGHVTNRAWIAAHVIPISLAGASDVIGFDVEMGIPNSPRGANQGINLTLAGGRMPNGSAFARLGVEFLIKRF